MTKIVPLATVSSFQNDNSAVSAVNLNSVNIEQAFNNTLSRDGSFPNQMLSSLDMNSNRILNLPTPLSNLEPMRIVDAQLLNGGGTITLSQLPVGGSTNQVLTKHSNSNFDVTWATITNPNSVQAFGAVGNGVASDSAAFNNAMAASKYVFALPGSYALGNTSITVLANTTIELQPGASFVFNGSGAVTLPFGSGGGIIDHNYSNTGAWMQSRSMAGSAVTVSGDYLGIGLTGTAVYGFTVISDTMDVSTGFLNTIQTYHAFGGPSANGSRQGIQTFLDHTSPTNPLGNSVRDYVGGTFYVRSLQGDGGTGTTPATAKGNYFGINPVVLLNSTAFNLENVSGGEFNVFAHAGATSAFCFNISLVGFRSAQVGALADAVVGIYGGGAAAAGGPEVGWKNVFLITDLPDGSGNAFAQPPVNSGSVLMQGVFSTAKTPMAVLAGIDLRNFAFFTNAFASPNFTVDGNGVVTVDVTSALIGTTSTNAFVLKNIAAAANNAQQRSPRILFQGTGWSTAGLGSSVLAEWIIENKPLQGNPINSKLSWSSRIGGSGSFTEQAFLTTGSGLFTSTVTGGTTGSSSLTLQSTNTSVGAVGGDGTSPSSDFVAIVTSNGTRFKVLSNGNIGIGTEINPQTNFVLSNNITAGITLASSEQLSIIGADGAVSLALIRSFGNSCAISFARADGTAASPIALNGSVTPEFIGGFAWIGYNGTNYTNVARIAAFANDNYSGSFRGSSIEFDTTPAGTAVRSQAMLLKAGLIVGTSTTDPGAGNLAVNGNITAGGFGTVGTVGAEGAAGAGTGIVNINGGDGTHTGFVAWFNPAAARTAFMGFDTASQLGLNLSTGVPFNVAGAGVTLGSPTGGDKGSGTVNASGGYYLNGADYSGKIAYMRYVLTGVNFNSANTDNSIAITLPVGVTRYFVNAVAITNASASISTATVGVFTQPTGGGIAICATQAITVTQSATDTTNNGMSLTVFANRLITALNDTPLYVRVGAAQGSAATADVVIVLQMLT